MALTSVTQVFTAFTKLTKEERDQFNAMVIGYEVAKSKQTEAGKKANTTKKAGGPKPEAAVA